MKGKDIDSTNICEVETLNPTEAVVKKITA